MKRFWVFLLLIVFVSFGCKQRVVTQPESQERLQQQKEQQEREESAKSKTTPEKITEQKTPALETVESQEQSKEEKEGLFKDVLFDFDKYNVQGQYKPDLKSIASWMMKHTNARLSVEGHCDERGTNEYNLALGDRRAKAVKDYLVSLGVPSSRIETLSYGEEKPFCTEHTEECWTKNRRAHFVVLSRGK
jgi:peptidoglycan-associated lipoprotein